MDLLPTPEQDEIVSSVDSFLTAQLPMTRLRELHGEGAPIDDEVWRRCAELGWFGLGLAEEHGGVGYGLAEEALLFREIGRHLAPGPFLSTVLAARMSSGAQRQAILDGSTRVALIDVHGGSVGPTVVEGAARVYDHEGEDLGLVVTRDGAAVLELGGLTDLRSAPSLDPSTRIATAHAAGLRPIGYLSASDDPLFQRGAVLVAAMATGIAEAVRDLSSEYAKSRVQFGKPIGVNQAIKHSCTDMAVKSEAAAMQTFMAAMSLDDGRADAAFQVASAKVVATSAALSNARASIQLHGGIGFTWEADAHLHLKRAHVLDHLIGSRRDHLAALLALPAAQ